MIPKEKDILIDKARAEVQEVLWIITGSYYKQWKIQSDHWYWTHTNSRLTHTLMDKLQSDKQGFNSIYMMMDSGARGSKEQIRQLSGTEVDGQTTKIWSFWWSGYYWKSYFSNFKEGLSILNILFLLTVPEKISDTALKTADAGYLTRRL